MGLRVAQDDDNSLHSSENSTGKLSYSLQATDLSPQSNGLKRSKNSPQVGLAQSCCMLKLDSSCACITHRRDLVRFPDVGVASLDGLTRTLWDESATFPVSLSNPDLLSASGTRVKF